MSTSIKDMLGTVESIFTATQKVVDGLDDGARLQVGDLSQTVGLSLGMDPKDILGFVSYYTHNIEPVAHVRRGKNGGLIKGARVVKKSKVQTTVQS